MLSPVSCRRSPQGRLPFFIAPLLAAATLPGSPGAASAQSAPAGATAPPVVYTIQATTLSGLGALAAGDLSAGGMMRLLMGGSAASFARTLELTLESSTPGSGAPRAEHQVPAGLGLGPVLPLVTPASANSDPGDTTPGAPPERPEGRLLIFRGCGESADVGQPEVIRLDALLPDQQALARSLAAMGAARAQAGRSRVATVVGRWPNAEATAAGNAAANAAGSVPATGSLVGAHTVSGTYTPTFAFNLDKQHDFLAPLQLKVNGEGPAWQLSWLPLAGVQGYLAMAAGAGQQEGDLVIWTSSPRRGGDQPLAGLGLFSPSGSGSGAAADGLLPPSLTSCAMSSQARQAMQAGVLTMLAPAAPQRLQAAGSTPGWRVQVERQALLVQPLMEGFSEGAPDNGGGRQGGGRGAGGGGTFNLFKGLF